MGAGVWRGFLGSGNLQLAHLLGSNSTGIRVERTGYWGLKGMRKRAGQIVQRILIALAASRATVVNEISA
jgi:hypothetical protein